MFVEKTLWESYSVKGMSILVKREDTFGDQPDMPALEKLRGARVVLQRMKDEGISAVGVYDTRIAKSGQGISYFTKRLGMKCYYGFPLLKGDSLHEPQKIARDVNGAELFPLTAGRTAICYANFKKFVESKGAIMLPLGLPFKETAEAVREIAQAETGSIATIVVSTGTGTIATGIALGTKATVYGISCGMDISRQRARSNKILGDRLISNLILVPPTYSYYEEADTSKIPFPTSKYYDGKAWEWLVANIEHLPRPVAFWNIGVS